MKTPVGVFQEKFDAESALDDLKEMGFEARDISVIVKKGAVNQKAGSKGGRSVEVFDNYRAEQVHRVDPNQT